MIVDYVSNVVICDIIIVYIVSKYFLKFCKIVIIRSTFVC